MTTERIRAALHRLIDEVPEGDLEVARDYLEGLQLAPHLPPALRDAPLDDEPDSEEEAAGAAEALAEYRRGAWISAEEAKCRLLG
jgi:hypothetical protein